MDSISRLLIYLVILSMASYPIPDLRFGGDVSQFPLGGFFLPIIFLLELFQRAPFRVSKPHFLWMYLWTLGIFTSSFNAIGMDGFALTKMAAYLLLTIVMARRINKEATLRQAFFCVIAVGVVLCLYGFYGYLTGRVGTEAETEIWQTYSRYWGVHYLQSTRNSDVYFVSLPLMYVLGYLIVKKGKQSTPARWLVTGLALLFFSALVLSFSRGAWLSFIGTLMMVLALLYRRIGFRLKRSYQIYLLIFFAVLVGYYILDYFGLTGYFLGKVYSIFNFGGANSRLLETVSNEDRWQILKATADIVIRHPFGTGVGTLSNYYAEYGLYINHPENYYLHVLAEMGIFAFAGFLVFMFYPVLVLSKSLNKDSSWLVWGITASAIYTAFSYLFNVEMYNFFNWLNHGLIWAATSMVMKSRQAQRVAHVGARGMMAKNRISRG